jgi:hypothetical protein
MCRPRVGATNPLFSLWRTLRRPTAPASRTKSHRTAEESWMGTCKMKYTETERNLPKRNEMKRNEIYRNETEWNVHKNWKGMQFTETEQSRICRNIHTCFKPDLDDHWSYKWLFLTEELWVVLFVDVHVIVGEHCFTFSSFQFQYKKTRIIMPRA